MQITQDENKGQFTIQSYRAGEIKINQISYARSLIVTPTQLIESWRPTKPQEIHADDIAFLQSLQGGIVLIGTGEKQHFLSLALLVPLQQAGIGVEVMSTESACRTFNILMSEGRNAIAALIL